MSEHEHTWHITSAGGLVGVTPPFILEACACGERRERWPSKADVAATIAAWETPARPANHSSVHLLPPPRITTQEANAAHVVVLEAENARLRAGLESLRQAHQAEDQDYSVFCPRARGGAICWCGADEHNERIDALLRGESCTG